LTISYILLTAGALFMLFPLVWMISASLKPEWQIFVRPIIWIPQKWHGKEAGNTGRMFGLWELKQGGETVRVINVGTRKYSAVVDVGNFHNLYSIPETAVSDPTPVEVEGVQLNVRTASIEGGEREVVALARDGDNFIVADAADFHGFASLSKPALREAEKIEVMLNDIALQASVVSIDGVERRVVPVGGEKGFATVVPPEAIGEAWLVRSERLRPLGIGPLGQSEAKVFELVENGEKVQVISLADERWQPIVDYEVARQAFSIMPENLVGEPELRFFGNAELDVQRARNPFTGEEQEIVILKRETNNVLVIDPQYMGDARVARTDQLTEPRAERFGGAELLVKDDFEDLDGRIHRVARVGEGRQMATVVTVEAVSDAYDVLEEILKRDSKPFLRWGNYIEALSKNVGGASFLTFFRNTAILEILNITGHLFSCTIVAYGFARLRAPGKTFLFVILLATMMLPFAVTMVPLYEIFVRAGEFTQRIGMFKIGHDTLWPLFIRAFFGNAFLIFLMRQFFMTIPMELEEAARIDGASRAQTLFYVLIPLTKPALATVVIFTFMWIWNDFMGPLIFLDSPHNFTVTLGLNFFQGQYEVHYQLLMAASTAAMLPMLLLFFFAQRFFIEGITMTGLKG
jgi:ABC-type glycerol-3-phosphate transport system permease component